MKLDGLLENLSEHKKRALELQQELLDIDDKIDCRIAFNDRLYVLEVKAAGRVLKFEHKFVKTPMGVHYSVFAPDGLGPNEGSDDFNMIYRSLIRGIYESLIERMNFRYDSRATALISKGYVREGKAIIRMVQNPSASFKNWFDFQLNVRRENDPYTTGSWTRVCVGVSWEQLKQHLDDEGLIPNY